MTDQARQPPRPSPGMIAKHIVAVARQGHGRFATGEGWVLDPTAGDGALLDVVRFLAPFAGLVAVEPDLVRARALAVRGFEVLAETFEQFTHRSVGIVGPASFDAMVMRPPVVTSVDPMAWVTHVELAFGLLAPYGRLVAVVPRSVEDQAGARFDRLRVLAQGDYQRLPDSVFRDSGTNLLVIDRGAPGVEPGW